jgi:hypothetical protein
LPSSRLRRRRRCRRRSVLLFAKADDDVVDAEFEEVKDDKK